MFPTILARAFALILIASIASCGGLPTVTPAAGTHIAFTPAVVLVTTLDGEPATARLHDGIIVCEMVMGNQFVLRKLTHDLTPLWTAPVHDGEEARSRLDTIKAEQTGEEINSAHEQIVKLYPYRGVVMLLTYRRTPYGLEFVGRTYDAANGSVLTRDVLHRIVGAELPAKFIRQVAAKLSPDSSKIAMYFHAKGENATAWQMDAIIFDSNLRAIEQRKFNGDDSTGQYFQDMDVDDAGNYYVSQMGKDFTLTVEKHSITGEVTKAVSVFAQEEYGIRIERLKTVWDGTQSLLLAAPIVDDNELVGLAVSRVNIATMTATGANVAISEEMLDDSELEYPHMHSLMRVEGPTRFVAVFEPRMNVTLVRERSGAAWPSSMTRDLVVLGLDQNIRPTWTRRVEKQESSPEHNRADRATAKIHLTSRNELHVLYLGDAGLYLETIHVGDGRPGVENRLLLEQLVVYGWSRGLTTWLNDNDLITMIWRQGDTRQSNIYRVKY
ncbi:MAG: hypothetical protein H7X80_02275 [bacterium]|nr:hypothetical protein [Candidatus Kapabacteria bacterium]